MYTKSIFASRMALAPAYALVIMDIYKEIHECGITHLKASYENEISRLRQEITTMRDEASKQEQKQDMQRLELREVEADKISLLHEVARLRETVTAKRSLDIIVAIYRHRVKSILRPRSCDPQSILSALISGALDSPWHNYAYSRKMAISLVDPALQEDNVDKAGHSLYNSCYKHLPLSGFRKPIVLTKGRLSPPSVAAFFSLAHFCPEANIQVEYWLKRGGIVAELP